MKRQVIAIAALVAATASEAHACYIPPLTAVQQTQQEMSVQTRLFEQSSTIYLARISRRRAIRVRTFDANWRGYEITLRSVRSIKGTPRSGNLVLRHTTFTSCGPSPGWDAMTGEVGEYFVLFSSSASPTQDTILDAERQTDIIQPDLLSALGQVTNEGNQPRYPSP